MNKVEIRKRLLDYLDEKGFLPILKYSGIPKDQETFNQVYQSVKNTRVRYYTNYPSPEAIRSNFISDLHSKPGKELAHKLKWLGFQTFEDIKDDFLKFYETLMKGEP